MPNYDYSCPTCGETTEVYQPMRESHESITCRCGGVAQRVWTVPEAQVESGESYYNYGLGCRVSNKHDIKDAMHRINDTTGQCLVDIGNERVKTNLKLARYPTAGELGY